MATVRRFAAPLFRFAAIPLNRLPKPAWSTSRLRSAGSPGRVYESCHERSSPRTDIMHESPRPRQRHPIRSTLVQEEAVAQAIFLHAIGDGIIPGALWWQILASWRRHPTQRCPLPAADASSSSGRDWRELQRRTHGEGSLDRQTKPAAGGRPCGDRGHLGTSGMFAKQRRCRSRLLAYFLQRG
jgi:hypothetical protein